MRHPTAPSPTPQESPDRRCCLAAVVGALGSERAAYWLAAALAGSGERVGLLTESCDDDGERCDPRYVPRDEDARRWLSRCDLGGVRVAVAQATPNTRVIQPSVVCITSLRGDALTAAGGRGWSSIADQRAELRRVADLEQLNGPLVVNADDPDGVRLGASHRGPVLTYGESDAADLRVEPLENNPGEQTLLATHGADSIVLTLRVAGAAARRDAAAALATTLALTGELNPAARGIELAGPVAGRLDPVGYGQDYGLWMDPAVRPDELAEAVQGVSCGDGRLLVISRLAEDPTAAQQQLELMSRTADRAFAHGPSDGLIAPPNVSLVEDELAALAVGIGLADPGDRVLAAGCRGQDDRDMIQALVGRRLACETTKRAA